MSSSRKPPRLQHIMQLCLLSLTLMLLLRIEASEAAVHSVLTYKNTSTQLGQTVTSSTLLWETYDVKNSNQLQYAVEGGKYISEEEHYPIYVCRVTIEGVNTIGHTEKIQQAHVCVAAHYKNTKYDHFDVLINKGHLGKVSWKHWRKFNLGIPVGAIWIDQFSYIARHKSPHSEGEHIKGADYNLGRLDPEGLGKIKAMEGDRQQDYDEGEVLIETEPFRYELKDIEIKTNQMTTAVNVTELASGILANKIDKYILVETVLSYEYDYKQYWGTHEGVARGLPTKVFENATESPAEIRWALKSVDKRMETKSVRSKLWPGTAINVTLKGNYMKINAPYRAKLYAFYAGSEDSISRKIYSEVEKSYLADVKLEFSPVYWIENGTFVPTTTTTSTTSTTTHATTTTGNPTPIHEPPLVEMMNVGETNSGLGSLETSMLDSPSSNEISQDKPDNLAKRHQKPAMAGIGLSHNASGATTLSQIVVFASIFTILLSLVI
ncbi:beta-pore-forming protein unzipped [Haematobia irritans]|uniref:beta-pore-forming protein unzipped n=1 Tax=Haematobia irritans TaxID=7368 RepID=UPI003F5082C9